MTVEELVSRLQAATNIYHNGGEPLMTDEEYDDSVEQLRALNPCHPFLAKIGARPVAGDEVSLPIPLPSLNKIKPDGSLEQWLTSYQTADYHVSVKLDGCSALWIPTERRLYTRGDGMVGRDISAYVPFIKGLSMTPTSQPIMVRGELIMRTDSPAVPAGKLARNIVAGALNRRAHEVDEAQLCEIHFVAYSLEQPAYLPPYDAYKLLAAAGYEIAMCYMIPRVQMTAEHLSTVFSTAEQTSVYQLDGMVIAPNIGRAVGWVPEVRAGAAVNPVDRVAWKTRLTGTSARTTVRAVEWNVSASGMLIPRVLFDPVQLSGAVIGAATGLHGRWIHDNAVGPGAEIEVRRAGDVIPQIIAVHMAAPDGPSMPSIEYVWDSVHVRLAAGALTPEAVCIQLTRALAELGAENVGPGVVAKLHASGFDTIGKIYAAERGEFSARVAGCGDKMAERIYMGIRAKQRSWTELNLLMASCCLPRGVGSSKLQTLLAAIADPADWTVPALMRAQPPGISQDTVTAIVATIPAYLAWKATNIPVGALDKPKAPASASPKKIGERMVVVFTGVRDKEVETALTEAGHTVAAAVTKATTHLVFADGPEPTTGKAIKAREVGAHFMTMSQFKEQL